MKNTIEFHVDEVTGFYDKEIPKMTTINCNCFQKSVNTFLKMVRHIIDDLESSSDDFDECMYVCTYFVNQSNVIFTSLKIYKKLKKY